ncbi:MAG: hypothetical protein ABRQ25_00215 [Clostridiaceae bacterium]
MVRINNSTIMGQTTGNAYAKRICKHWRDSQHTEKWRKVKVTFAGREFGSRIQEDDSSIYCLHNFKF